MMENPKNRKWKVLTSEYLARKPWFTVRHESLELPDGRRIPDYYVFEYPDWINVTAVTRDGRFVLIDQPARGRGKPCIKFPPGPPGRGDPPRRTAGGGKRREERGAGGGQGRRRPPLGATPATQNNLTYCYLATGVEPLGEQRLDPTEDLRVHLLTREEVLKLLRTDRIRQALMAAPLWRYFGEGNE